MLQLRMIKASCLLSRHVCQNVYIANYRQSILQASKPWKNASLHRLFSVTSCFNAAQNVNVELPSIPATTPINADVTQFSDVVTKIVDPPFTELGLATGWAPSHWIQSFLETVHLTTDMSWSTTLIVGTFALRLILLPVFVKTRKGMINYRNHSPKLMSIREKFSSAIRRNDLETSRRARSKLKSYSNEHKIGGRHLLMNNLPMPMIFLSCMIALRGMCGAPVPSLEAAEFFWISSLTAPDPYRILPALAGTVFSISIFTSLKLGSVPVSPAINRNLKYICLLPPILVPLLFGHWSSAIGLYVLTNSLATFGVTLLLLSETVKQKLNFPEMVQHESTGFKSVLKTTLDKSRRQTELKLEDREIKKLAKALTKERKKELKGSPPALYEIGTQAKLKIDIPDFKKDWRPPRVNIYD
ncbi:mitochondrial inner membrane protein OXA1L-like [Clavelina lepadiformis]|uniref:mitochondrial inner membrane protein OXA1L-like n=1 Tax=Clavelina lepadiformis TaxID=159417 RepID=UPI004042D861